MDSRPTLFTDVMVTLTICFATGMFKTLQKTSLSGKLSSIVMTHYENTNFDHSHFTISVIP